MNNPRETLESMKRDNSVKHVDREAAANLIKMIDRCGDSITSLVSHGRDASHAYETLYNLEIAAWTLIERY